MLSNKREDGDETLSSSTRTIETYFAICQSFHPTVGHLPLYT